jgi:hypothetical protein
MSNDEDLRRRIEELPREIAPERDLWPAIARRARPRRRWPARAAIAGLGLAAAAAVVLATRRPPEPKAPVATAPSAAPSVAPAPAPLPGEAEYATALASLEDELAQRRPEMPEHARAAIDEDLRVVDAAIGASRAALVERPGDPELQAELDRAYDDKLDLLREATELLTGI